MIEIEKLTKAFGSLAVLKGIDLSVSPAEVVSIVGSSGAGKTTLLQIIGSLDKPTGGNVRIDGIDLFSLHDNKLASFRNHHIGFVFQSHQLLPEFTALENVIIPALIAKTKRYEAIKRGKELLDYLGLAKRIEHKPSELSGGEQQRVAVARALINRPKIILADEPSGNLDSLHATELHQLFFQLRNDYHQTFIIATHNEQLAGMADRRIVIKDGKLL